MTHEHASQGTSVLVVRARRHGLLARPRPARCHTPSRTRSRGIDHL